MSVIENVTDPLPGLKPRRRRAGLTQKQLADAVGCFRETIARLETGKQNPSMGLLRRLAAVLKCDPADLFRSDEIAQGGAA